MTNQGEAEDDHILESLIQREDLDFVHSGDGDHSLHDVLDLDLPYPNFINVQPHDEAKLKHAPSVNHDNGTPAGTSGFNGSGGHIFEVSEVNSGTFGAETGSSGKPGVAKRKREQTQGQIGGEKKTSQMKGRFSGRLPTKDDEKRLVEECKMIGPYLHENPHELNSVATIIRAIAAGTVRNHLENMSARYREIENKLRMIESLPDGNAISAMSDTILNLQNELAKAQTHIRLLENPEGRGHGVEQDEVATRSMFDQGRQTAHVVNGHSLDLPCASHQGAISSIDASVPQGLIHRKDMNITQTGSGAVNIQTQMPAHNVASFHDAGSLAQPMIHRTISTVSLQSQPLPDQRGSGSNAVTTEGSGDKIIQDHAQNLVRAASLHGVAKSEAASQAQQLAVEAQKHAQASVKAAQQAEELKKTLSSLPESELISDQVQQAAATVSSLEARAQAHASITTQVVAKARDMHEIAQTHEKEEIKAMAQASLLQSHAGGLPECLPLQPPTIASGPTVATPSLGKVSESMIAVGITDEHSKGHASDGLPNTALHLSSSSGAGMLPEQQHHQVAIAQAMLQQGQVHTPRLFNPSQIVYTNSIDPSTEAADLQQQIAALHAQQPESLVSAPPIHISDVDVSAPKLIPPTTAPAIAPGVDVILNSVQDQL